MNHKLKITEKFADELRQNEKYFENMSLIEIYLIIFSFKYSDQELAHIYPNLFNYFSSLTDRI